MRSGGTFETTAAEIAKRSQKTSECLVAFSAGKDSLVVLDMACRAFKSVVAFYLYLVPGLRVIEDRLEAAAERWKVEILQYPHWIMVHDIKANIYCPKVPAFDSVTVPKPADVYAMIREETGIRLIITGDKKADFVARRAVIKREKDDPELFRPIADWRNEEVLAYLGHHGIPIPDANRDCSGIDLRTDSLLWLHDNYPDDFKELCRTFPFALAVVKRRELYGVV